MPLSRRTGSISHTYRSDIDGLRAVAVVAVVIFHAFATVVPGGFVGVDVFFVISGFLITTNIVSGLESSSFTIRNFYERRARRIFPALFVVLASSFAIGWTMLFDLEFRSLGKHIAAGASFASNLLLWAEAGYFDTASELKPLVHLWSLGVEEQFYLLWPLVLWGTYRLSRRSSVSLIVVTSGILVTSFILSVMSVHTVGGYYSPINRFWELLIGALLALMSFGRSAPLLENIGRLRLHALSIVGLALMIVPMFTLSGASAFPGWNALAPTVGSALLIATGPSTFVGRQLLSRELMVYLGLISYPLYLWHWPLLVFARILNSGTPSAGLRLGVVLLSLVLAHGTYRYIERPVRNHPRRTSTALVLASSIAAIGAVGAVTFVQRGFEWRRFNDLNVTVDAGEVRGLDDISVEGCGLSPEVAVLFADCRTDRRGTASYALIGDSKASALIGGLMRTSDHDALWTMLGGTLGLGSAVPLISEDPGHERFQALVVPAVDAVIAEQNIDVVVLQGAIRAMFEYPVETNFDWLPANTNFAKVEAALAETTRRLVDGGKRVVLFADNPALAPPEDCANRRPTIGVLTYVQGDPNPECETTRRHFLETTAEYRQMLERVATSFDGAVSVFDPIDVYCSEVCGHVNDGIWLYSYTDHPSDDAADRVGERLNDYLAEW